MAISSCAVIIDLVGFDGAYPWTVAGFPGHLIVVTRVALRSRSRVAAEMWLITLVFGVVVGHPGSGDDTVMAMVVLFTLAFGHRRPWPLGFGPPGSGGQEAEWPPRRRTPSPSAPSEEGGDGAVGALCGKAVVGPVKRRVVRALFPRRTAR
ncbi:hypothetical protein ACGF5T_16940 [Streptomyces sp. NPDC047853]|uniref:hypothetical protein n=1 Tax=unclassified Streptomyces TaxID=2593676 RepID=UPI0034562CAE